MSGGLGPQSRGRRAPPHMAHSCWGWVRKGSLPPADRGGGGSGGGGPGYHPGKI
jgi:hypothetical protein